MNCTHKRRELWYSALLSVLLGTFLLCRAVPAGAEPPPGSDESIRDPGAPPSILVSTSTVATHRLEENVSYDRLWPETTYGSRTDATLDYFTIKPGFVWYAELASFSWKEGDGMQAGVGCYRDWSARIYTYSALATGTDVDYLPKLRFDTDFNVKLGHASNIVVTLGITDISYHTEYDDEMLSVGGTYYGTGWVGGYRLFQNTNEPGNVVTYSHQFSVAVGAEGKQWTYLIISHGITGYTATAVFPSQLVTNDVDTFDLHHRHWLTKRFGMMVGTQYILIKDAYNDLQVSLGSFFEF
ncbi:MAG: YaiO family outer membrane beta-barrel protein [Endomicrobiales bacterium]